MRVIGLMSGTSLDGVDAALLETDGETILAPGRAASFPYPDTLRRDLRSLLDRATRIDADDADLLAVERELTLRHAEAVRALGEDADAVGFHGQTILHRPGDGRTWQIGDAALLARETGLPVVHDFRGADVASGGQGAPFAPAYHAALAAGMVRPLVVLNIGGVANVTFVGADGALLAWDTGPGNALLDDFCARHTGEAMDRDGRLASAGTPHAPTLARLMEHPYFRRQPPKSLDRLDFPHAAAAVEGLAVADGAATLVAFTARSALLGPWPAMPRRVLVTGGGRHNPAIMAALREVAPCDVMPVEAVGWRGDMLEAECFAYLAVRSLRGMPLSFPGTTGVPVPVTGGRVAHPEAGEPG
ncbi:MAG TPA: anhydro-N-acetylmuramic acid kinase [Acetobacteraceae bacterium]|nr:anhydro-N-acetylmuramic acid kinase [Acetobacteraceae bacterium]